MSIDAMKQALAALEQYTNVVTSVNDPNSWVTVADGGKPARDAITALRAAIEQSTWVKSYAGGKPNYTTPEEQTRQWQGLTEAEKVNVAIDCGCADVAWMDFADAIEAKLKEKNL